MSKKNIQMQVLGENGYDEIYPVPAGHASSHGKNGIDPITPVDIGAQSEIPITRTPDNNVKIWIDPNEDGDGSWYTKAETDGLLGSKADLGSDGKVLSTQLPDLKPTKLTLMLSSSGWDSSAKTQTVTVEGVLADETKQIIQPCPASNSITAYYDAGILCTGQDLNSLTFTADSIPLVNLTVYIVIQEV